MAAATPRPSDEPALSRRLLDILHGNWMTQALRVAAEWRLADLIASGLRTAPEIAQRLEADQGSIQRLLRALAAIGICHDEGDGTFGLTDMGHLIREDHPGSLRAWCLWWGSHLWPLWENLDYSVRTGKSARAMLLGTEGFAHLERDPGAAVIFNRALSELTRLTARAVIEAYDFRGLNSIVDVGGGHGELLGAVLRAAPKARGVLFDLAHSLEGARRHLREEGVLERCEFVAGDFFESVPTGADAYMLKSVLHDWDDQRAAAILRRCREAMLIGSRLLVVEQVVPDVFRDDPVHRSLARSDLTMLTAHGAGERTEAQYRRLFDEAGIRITRIIPAGITFSIIEGRKAEN